MNTHRLLEAVYSPNICQFCLHRFENSARSRGLTHASSRRFTYGTKLKSSSSAQALAQGEEPEETIQPTRKQPIPKWGQFAKTREHGTVSFPDPDLLRERSSGRTNADRGFANVKQRVTGSSDFEVSKRHGRVATSNGHTEVNERGHSFPESNYPQRNPRAALPPRYAKPPGPRWDEPAGLDSSRSEQRTHRSAEESPANQGRKPLIRWHSGNVSAREEGFRPRYARASTRDEVSDGEQQFPASRTTWGRHLKVRRPEVQKSTSAESSTTPEKKFSPLPNTDARVGRHGQRTDLSGFRSLELGASQERSSNKTSAFVSFRNHEPTATQTTGRNPSQFTPLQRSDKIDEQDSGDLAIKSTAGKSDQVLDMPLDLVFAVEAANARAKHDKISASKAKIGKKEARLRSEVEDSQDSRSFDSPHKGHQRKQLAKDEEADFEYSEFGEDFGDDPEFRREKKKKKKAKQQQRQQMAEKATQTGHQIELPPFIAVEQLATALKIRLDDFVERLDELGFEDIANDHVLNFENASLIAMEYGFETKVDQGDSEDLVAQPPTLNRSLLPPRPPVVTIMGHVDHGKTTLLDYLRKSSVAATEHGGITQHIGAFSVPMASGKLITFLDTPGHAAFLGMRQRGANVTDIVVLVVAADDSVKPQTIEAIKHAKTANVPIIVAINKVDKEEADIQRVKQDLLRHDIEVEDFGGDVQAIPVSGKTGQGLDELEEALVAQAETIDMRAEADGLVEGWVLEASTKKAGRVATVLVRRGTLRPGDVIVAGSTWARVRTLKNEAGVQLPEASPGTPAEVDGWRDMPTAGDEVLQATTEQKATAVVQHRAANRARKQDAIDMEAINEARRLDSLRREREKAEKENATKKEPTNMPGAVPNPSPATRPKPEIRPNHIELFYIVKADVSGSTEAIESFIAALPLSKHPISISILRAAVGQISESDVDLIATVPSGCGYIVSFNQAVPQAMAKRAEEAGVKIFDENIIYKVMDSVKAAVETHLPPLITKKVVGEAEAAQVFEINVGGRNFIKIIGCRIRNGMISKGKKVRVYRGGMDEASIVYDGIVTSLKYHKKDVAEMRKGSECGMGFENWEEFQPGDTIQCYDETSEPRRLA